MKFNDEIEQLLPSDIGYTISQHLSIMDLFSATRVCKNWNSFFSDNNLLKMKLRRNGFLNYDLETLQKLESVSKVNNLFPVLGRKEMFLNAYFKHNNNQKLLAVPLKDTTTQVLSEHFYQPNPSLSEIDRVEQLNRFLQRCELRLYLSQFHYIAYHFLGTEHVNMHEKFTPITFEKGETDITEFEFQLLEICKHNKTLTNSLTKLNSNEIKIFNLFFTMSRLKDVHFVSRSVTAESSIIPTDNGKLYFIHTCQANLIQNLYSNSQNFSREDSKINFQLNMALEITEKDLILQDYSIFVSSDLFKYAENLLNDSELLNQICVPTSSVAASL